MTVALGNEHVALAVESNFVRSAQLRSLGRPAIPGMALRSITCDHGNNSRPHIKSENAIAPEVRPIECAVGSNDQTIRIIDGSAVRRVPVGGASRHPDAGD